MIDRRSLLSFLGVSATGVLRAKGAPDPRTAGVFALESFHVADAEQMLCLHAYLGALLPLLSGSQHGPAICLEAVVAPKTPQALMLAAYSSFDEVLAIRSKIATHPSLRNMRAELESAGVIGEVLSQVLVGTQKELRFPPESNRLKTGIFELRSYRCSRWQTAPPSALTEVFSRAGIHPIVDGAFAAGEHIPQFTYLIPFQSLAARQEAWSCVAADRDWIDLEHQAIKDSSRVRVMAKSIYKLAPYSRLA